MSLRISELAKRLGAGLENASVNAMVDALAMADIATANEVSFIIGVRAQACAGAVLVGVAQGQRNALVVDNAILAHVVIHAAVLGNTVIAQGCILDSQVLIGHDSVIGAGSAIAGQAAIAGAARIGRNCRIGGKVGVGEGVQIADGVTVTAMSMVTRSIKEASARYSSGWPAEPSPTWWRRVAQFRRPRQ